MSVTLNVYVKNKLTGVGIPNARVIGLTKNQIIDPPVRQTSGDGGANLYYNGPEFSPAVMVSLAVDAAGYKPWSTEDKPIMLGSSSVEYFVELEPGFKQPGRDQIVNVQANFCNLLDSEGWVIFDNFIDALISTASPKADDWARVLLAAGTKHITLDLSGDYDEPLNWAPRYPLPGHDWTNDILGFSQILDWVLSRGFIPIVKLATDGLGYDPVGMTHGWKWGMDNLPNILSSLGKYHNSVLWSPTWDGGFPVWSPDQTLSMLKMLRSVLGEKACIDMEFGSPPSESISYCHMGNGQADWAPDKLGDLDTFSLELQTYPPVEEGIREAATRLLGPNATGGIPTSPYYLVNAKTKPIFFETTAYWSMRKWVSSEQNRDVADMGKKYGFSSFGNGLPH